VIVLSFFCCILGYQVEISRVNNMWSKLHRKTVKSLPTPRFIRVGLKLTRLGSKVAYYLIVPTP